MSSRMSECVIRVYRAGEGKRREQDSKLLAESSWSTDEDMIEEIAEYAGGMIEEAIRCDCEKEPSK